MRVEVGSASWQNLETLMGSSMTVGTSYDVQVVKGQINQQVMVVEGASEPTDPEDGFVITFNQGFTVKKESGVNVYVKSFNAGCVINVAEGE